MKNTVISIVCNISVAVYSVFSSLFIDSFTKKIEDKIIYADNNGYNAAITENMQQILDKNMSVLLFTTSQEQINVIENCIINIRYATEYNDAMNIQINKSILLNTLEEISRLYKSPV